MLLISYQSLLQVVSEALDVPVQQQILDNQACEAVEVIEGDLYHNKTVVTASDGQVSNGFVLQGQNLPYVFEEATDPSGNIFFFLL